MITEIIVILMFVVFLWVDAVAFKASDYPIKSKWILLYAILPGSGFALLTKYGRR